MVTLSRIRKLASRITRRNPVSSEYWKSEGICKIESTAYLIVPQALGGSAIVSTGKQYCVRR